MLTDDIPEGKCPVCGKMVVIVRATRLLAPHNLHWNKPNAIGVARPTKCSGGGSKPAAAD